MPSHGKYPDEMSERPALVLVLEPQHEYWSQWEAICSIVENLPPAAETIRL
jgi:hypothetical protein